MSHCQRLVCYCQKENKNKQIFLLWNTSWNQGRMSCLFKLDKPIFCCCYLGEQLFVCWHQGQNVSVSLESHIWGGVGFRSVHSSTLSYLLSLSLKRETNLMSSAFRISLGLVDFPEKGHRYTEYIVFLVQFVILILNSLGSYLESGGFCTMHGNEMWSQEPIPLVYKWP